MVKATKIDGTSTSTNTNTNTSTNDGSGGGEAAEEKKLNTLGKGGAGVILVTTHPRLGRCIILLREGSKLCTSCGKLKENIEIRKFVKMGNCDEL